MLKKHDTSRFLSIALLGNVRFNVNFIHTRPPIHRSR